VPSRAAQPEAAANAAALTAARQAASTFRDQRQRLDSGKWAVLGDPPSFEPGPLGAWDDFSMGSPVVVKDDSGAGNSGISRYQMFFRACHMALREYSCGVGRATSDDGVVWARGTGAAFTPADSGLREGLDEIAVAKVGGRYFLWYSVLADPYKGRPHAVVRLASSSDAVMWKDEGLVLDGGSQALFIRHSVFHDGQTFHMWYATKVKDDPSPLLQHFTSPDGKAWTVAGGTRLLELQPQPSLDMGRLSIIAVDGGKFFALFTHDSAQQSRNTLGSLVSDDGGTWTVAHVDVDPLKDWPKKKLAVGSLSGISDRDGLWLWMLLRSEQGATRVGVAFKKGERS
jgi:hypothetical protein